MRNKEAKMLDRTNETSVNGTENEIGRVNFLEIAGGLRRKIEKTFGMKEKRCTFGLLNQNCIIMKSEENELERQLREAKRTIRVSLIVVIVLSFCLVGLSIVYFMRGQMSCRNQEKMVECHNKNLCVKQLGNGDIECCDCKEVLPEEEVE